ncbi:MAG: GNAT family N-acetyltransferase [Bacteroidales bacterium]|jgi:RimJ/RimL family protein N-acetyltransferase|nr:GNAT family N-acetyltransferase [Bacteroidales bacterium]
MKLSKYGITLRRLRERDIELVRTWRNSQQISQFMEYREQITPEMQREWFKSVDNFDNFYYIIEYQGEDIGLINSSKIDWRDVSSEGGIFLWDEKYYETFVPVWASLCLLETSFFILGASGSVIKTLMDNERARKLNQHLGYELQPGQDEVYNQVYVMTAESFRHHAAKLIKAARLMAGNDPEDHRVFFDKEDIQSGLADFVYSKIDKETIADVSETEDGRMYIFKSTTV